MRLGDGLVGLEKQRCLGCSRVLSLYVLMNRVDIGLLVEMSVFGEQPFLQLGIGVAEFLLLVTARHRGEGRSLGITRERIKMGFGAIVII